MSHTLENPAAVSGTVVPNEDVLAPVPTVSLVLRRRIVAVIDPVMADGTSTERIPSDVVVAAAHRLTSRLQAGELVSATPDGRLLLQLRREDRSARPLRLQEMAYHALSVLSGLTEQRGDVDLGVGWAPVTRRQDVTAAAEAAGRGAEESLRQRDLQPRQDGAHVRSRNPRISRLTVGRQVLWATLGSILLPFAALVGLNHIGIDLGDGLYWVLVLALLMTSISIWAECSHAFTPAQPPPTPTDREAPTASAIIAAYLPNEAETIVETVTHFLSLDYAGRLQIILSYNTPVPLAVEAELAELEDANERLTVLKVPDSTSKAQNVNAALHVVEGEFVGVFDADHHPVPGSFDRAWRWIAGGHDVVQGHCVIRNGDDGWLQRLVAVEFEQIYAVAHPGRANLHEFGIFGGSNGYWRTSELQRIRMRGSYLTEDIEASMRALGDGASLVNDPGLVSEELAPESVTSLWNQRMRWAQGWFQVSIRHLPVLLRADHLSLRQKAGLVYLLGWREIYPWISMAVWPLLGYLAWRDGGLNMDVSLFAMITLFVTASGPVQTLAAYRLAAPSIRRRPWWFAWASVVNLLAYTESKNLVNRVAQLKQLRGEHQWVVTPRTAASTSTSRPDSTDDVEVTA